MVDEEFWKAVQRKERASGRSRKTGLLNIVLLFGTAAIALSLILTPMLSDSTGTRRLASAPDDVDMISTGSIRKQDSGKRYTIRRSILQETPGSVCIVDGYGPDKC